MGVKQFSWYNYVSLILLLGLTVILSLYYVYFVKTKDNIREYLLGNKRFGTFSIVMSLITSAICAIRMLSYPGEVYFYGTHYVFLIGMGLCGSLMYYIYLPVICELNLISIHHYIEMRFNRKLRLLLSGFMILNATSILPFSSYASGLTFCKATGFNVHIIIPTITGICVFYTTIGGAKGVVWADTLQMFAIIISLLTIMIVSIIKVGGMANILRASLDGGRLDFDFDLNPLKRDTFWTIFIGCSFHFTAHAAQQGFMQRFLALPTLKQCKRTFVLFYVGYYFFIILFIIIGLTIYTKFENDDPITSGTVKKLDELFPYFVLETLADTNGLPGIFMFGILSAGLSTLSSALNAAAAMIHEDFLQSYLPKNFSEKTITNIVKLVVVVLGLICISLTYVVEHLGEMLAAFISIHSVLIGPAFGTFLLGMIVPKASSREAFCGIATSTILMAWMVFGAQYYKYIGLLKYPTKVLINRKAIHAQNSIDQSEIFFMYRISHNYHALIGTIIAFSVGTILSIFKKNYVPVKPELIAPICRRFLPNVKKDIVYAPVKRNSIDLNEDNYGTKT